MTIVCCYNDSRQYERLCASLEKQNIAYDLISIDNRGQKFCSCSSALNSVLSKVQTEYLIYTHQDIELPETGMLGQFVKYLEQIGKKDILGVAGAMPESGAVASYVRHGKELICVGEVKFEGFIECDTVDECFFGGRTETFLEEPLNEKLCDDWHLYAVERCLRARVQGNRVWVCDLSLLHYSSGNINHAYNKNFRRIAEYYAKNFRPQNIKCIHTVCGSTKTDWLHRTLFYWKREILFRLHRL